MLKVIAVLISVAVWTPSDGVRSAETVWDGHTELERKRLSPIYQDRLNQCLHEFGGWLRDLGIRVSWRLIGLQDLERLMDEYVQHLYNRGRAIWVAKHAILALQTARPECRRFLGRAWHSIRGWQRSGTH